MAERALKINPRDLGIVAKLAGYTGELGDTTRAVRYLEYFGSSPDPALTGETIFEVGAAMEAVGWRKAALVWIEEALERGFSKSELMLYPGLNSLRSDPDFKSILNRYGTLPEAIG